MLMYSHIDCIIICRGLDSRIETENDLIKCIDTLAERHVSNNVNKSTRGV